MNSDNILMLKSAFTIAAKTGAGAVLLHADPMDDLIFEEKMSKKFDLIILTKKKKFEAA
jgi:hypothetical protein